MAIADNIDLSPGEVPTEEEQINEWFMHWLEFQIGRYEGPAKFGGEAGEWRRRHTESMLTMIRDEYELTRKEQG